MKTRERQKSETRSRLLAAAARLFAAEGFLRARTADVARAAGLSHGAVFIHFSTREDLVAAVIRQTCDAFADRLHARAHAKGRVRDLLAAHLESIGEQEELYRRLLLEWPHLPPTARTAWIGMQSALAIHIADAAEEEMDAGRIRRMPVHLLFNTWVGLVHHYVANRDLFAPGGSVVARHGALLLDHYAGLLDP